MWSSTRLVSIIVAAAAIRPATADELAPAERIEEICATIRDHYVDETLGGLDWDAICIEYAARAETLTDPDGFTPLANEMLTRLGLSHTSYHSPREMSYYELVDLFFTGREWPADLAAVFPNGHIRVTSVGIVTREFDGRPHIIDILDGTPASTVDLLPGDEIISVDGDPFHQVESFQDKANVDVTITARRTLSGATHKVTVRPDHRAPGVRYQQSVMAGRRVIERGDARVAIVPIRSYAGRQYQDALIECLSTPPCDEADALVLDIRGGWGGASPEYLNYFNDRIPSLTQTHRDGRQYHFRVTWTRPTVLLIDGGSRSGKELFAYGFRRMERGPIVGTTTAGAVSAGQPFILSDGSLLMVCVGRVLIDGVELEGVGVTPDIVVDRDIPYSAGRDAQLDRAIETAADLVTREDTP